MPRLGLGSLLVLGTGLLACSGGEARQELIVSAASSLTEAFRVVEEAFEDANPGIDVILNLGASSSLRVQILEGAPVDVFASADIPNMAGVEEAGLVDDGPFILAANTLLIVTPRGNPAGVDDLTDFANEELFIGLCAVEVPCGDLALDVLASAGVTPAIDTLAPDVRSLLLQVSEGELDAGIVYVTDARTRVSVEAIMIPDEHNVSTDYPIAVLEDAPPSADAFVDFVLSPAGRAILEEHGYSVP